MFTPEELQNLSILLQRVEIKGNEALAVANIQVKIGQMLQPKPEKPEEKNEEARNKKA